VSVRGTEAQATLEMILVIVVVVSLVKDQEKGVTRAIVLTGATKRKNHFLIKLLG